MTGSRARRARRSAGLAAALLLAALRAAAQHDVPAAGDVPDVPAGPATLRGEVIHEQDPARAGGVEVLLYALPSGGSPGLRRTTTDAQGHFAFEHISNDPQVSYLVGARYAGIPFPGRRVSFAAGEAEQRAAIRIGEATEDASAVSVAESQIRLGWQGARIGVDEVHQLENHGARTVYVPAARRQSADGATSAPPLFETRLPSGAEGFGTPLGVAPEGLVHAGDQVRFYGPLYPSGWDAALGPDQGLSFHYTLPVPTDAAHGGKAARVQIRKAFPSGARRLVVTVPAGGPELHLAGAREEKAPKAEGETEAQRRWVVDGVAPGATLALALELPPTRSAPEALALDETRIFLELDDTALQVREEHHFKVDGDLPIVGAPGQPLLKLPLPPGAADLRFDRDAFAWGLSADGEGGVEIDGPLPPGENDLELAYQLPLPRPGEGIDFERSFGRSLPLLSLYVADTGLRTESQRLHRRRPVATSDRTYLHLEAFEVEPGEAVRVQLDPLQRGAGLRRSAAIALVALAVALGVGFLVAPLRGRPSERAGEDDALDDAAHREREAVYAALRDLEHDHETAKVSEEDYAAMRQELRARAALLIREEQRGAARAPRPLPASPVAPPRFCTACGHPVRAGDRFCAQCGASLAVAEREATA